MGQNNNSAGKRMLKADFGNSLIDIREDTAARREIGARVAIDASPRLQSANNYFKLGPYSSIFVPKIGNSSV
jgi:hypothetical protein